MTRRMKSPLVLATFAVSVAMVAPADAWLAGPDACFSTQQGVHTAEHKEKRSCGFDCIISLNLNNPNSVTATVYDFHLRNYPSADKPFWDWDTFKDKDSISVRVGVMSNDTRAFSAVPIASESLGNIKREDAGGTVNGSGIVLGGLLPNHYYTFIIYSPDLAGVNSRGGHTAPFVRRCFRSASEPK